MKGFHNISILCPVHSKGKGLVKHIFFIYLLDVKLCKKLNGVLLTIDQHNDLIDKPDHSKASIHITRHCGIVMWTEASALV